MTTFEVALEALRADALQWSESSGVLRDFAGLASGLTVTPYDLSFISINGLAQAYAMAKVHMQLLLVQGALETERIAQTLLDVRKAYESTDASAVAALKKSWEPQ